MAGEKLYKWPYVNHLFMNDMSYYYCSLDQRGFALEGPYCQQVSEDKKAVYIIEAVKGFSSRLHVCGYEEKRFFRKKIRVIPESERKDIESKLLEKYTGIGLINFWDSIDAERGSVETWQA